MLRKHCFVISEIRYKRITCSTLISVICFRFTLLYPIIRYIEVQLHFVTDYRGMVRVTPTMVRVTPTEQFTEPSLNCSSESHFPFIGGKEKSIAVSLANILLLKGILVKGLCDYTE